MQLIEGFLERFKQHKQLTAEQPATTVKSYLESLSPHDREHVQYLLGIVSVYNRNLSGDHPFTVIAEGSTLRTDYRIPQDVDLRLLCAVNPSHPKRGHAIRGMNNVLETLLNSEAIKFDIGFPISTDEEDEGQSYIIYFESGLPVHVKTQNANSRTTQNYLSQRDPVHKPFLVILDPIKERAMQEQSHTHPLDSQAKRAWPPDRRHIDT
ncbi:MAG TPA: hypothetical protein VJL83_00185 [Patescibacteria group bacterium]|nr:hypothetical protein [Patescibacteria group bacterium]